MMNIDSEFRRANGQLWSHNQFVEQHARGRSDVDDGLLECLGIGL